MLHYLFIGCLCLETFVDVAVDTSNLLISMVSKCQTLTVLKLGKRLRGEDPFSLKGRRCLRSSWGCRGLPGTGREARSGLPWADVPGQYKEINIRR